MLEWATRFFVFRRPPRVALFPLALVFRSGIWLHVLEHQQSKTETTLDSDFLEMLEWATRRAESNELSSDQIGSVVVELIAGIFLHVLVHQQSKS